MAPELILPAGYERVEVTDASPQHGMIVNDSGLPDELVRTYFEEHASMLGVGKGTTFQTYSNEGGSMLNRRSFRVPASVLEEICLARSVADTDDDVGSTIGMMVATAFESGMQNTHEDEVTIALYDEMAAHAHLDYVFGDMYRELLISSSVTTVSLFVRESMQFQPDGADRQRTREMAAPLIGILPAEQVYVLDNDLFRRSRLAYRPKTASEERFLIEYFSPKTPAARKAELRRLDPVLTALVTEMVELPADKLLYDADSDEPPVANVVFVLNPTMVHRSTLPKGAAKHPRPLLTRNFALLEAKRLLNIMDFSLLQGGANFLVVAKKGSDQRPAEQLEVDNLHEVVKRASRSGVIIGDHRLSIEIITPKLDELLNPEKRRLVGRKLAMALLRLPENATESPGQEGMRAEIEMLTRVIGYDRLLLRRHVENQIYAEVARRNPGDFPKGAANVWFPKIILQGTQYFTDFVLKLRDRGDISRQSTIEAGGFDYRAEVQQRRREKASGDDRALTPPPVPFSSPNQGPQDNNSGRPAGGSSGPGQPGRPALDPARPQRQLTRNAGETVKAYYEDGVGSYYVGELTHALLEQYDSSRTIGRLTRFELAAIEAIARGEFEPFAEGPLTIVPVNPGYAIEDVKAVRLAEGVALLVGVRSDDEAIVARALSFRAPEFTRLRAEATALEWGFPTDPEPENA